jgi:hypothetical protein
MVRETTHEESERRRKRRASKKGVCWRRRTKSVEAGQFSTTPIGISNQVRPLIRVLFSFISHAHLYFQAT